MPTPYPAEVGRVVHYRVSATKSRPAVVTAIASTQNVTASSRTSGVTTLTVNNSLAVPRFISVALTDTSYNGIFLIASANGTTVTYNQPGAPNDASGGTGTIRDVDVASLRVGHHGETYPIALRRHGGSPVASNRWYP